MAQKKKEFKGLNFYNKEERREIKHLFSATEVLLERPISYDKKKEEFVDSWIKLTIKDGENKDTVFIIGKTAPYAWVVEAEDSRNREPIIVKS